MGSALENFTDFVKSTGPAYLTSPERLINEAVKETYVLGRFLRGRDMDQVVQGGRVINDDIMFDDASTYDHYQPNDSFSWTQPQVMKELSIPWRFSIDHMSWTDQEVVLNISDGLTRDAAKVQYKRLKRKIEQRMWTSMINGIENDLWANPHGATADMETTSGKIPYSIPAFITEDTTNYHANGWGDVQTLDPSLAANAKWRNQVSRYDSGDPDDSDGDADGLIHAFDDMWLKCRFIPPNVLGKGEYFESLALQTSKQMICTSRSGMNLYKRMLRDSNDSLVSKQDPAYNNPQYSGIDVLYIATLDTATLYLHSTSTAATEENSSLAAAGTAWAVTDWTQGPRFYWINGNYITPVFHSSRYFYKKDPMIHPNQPYTSICPVDCWWNLFMNSRMRHGIVSPGA